MGVNWVARIVTPEDGAVKCRAGNLNRFWVHVESEDGEQEDVVLLLNATDSGKDFVLDRVFLENWYGMGYDSLTYGEGIDLVQMLCVSVRSLVCASLRRSFEFQSPLLTCSLWWLSSFVPYKAY